MKKKEESYVLTIKGYIWSWLMEKGYNLSIYEVDNLLDGLYVFLHKNKCNAILFDDGEVEMIKVKIREK